jgi:STE24 endopeptidase
MPGLRSLEERPPLITAFFALAIAAQLALRLWLCARQIRHVQAHAAAVPEAFAPSISVADHQRAARYTIAKQKLGAAHAVGETLVLALLTWGGGLQALAEGLAPWLGGGIAFEFALVAGVVALAALADLPFDWIRKFRVEQAFGFNRMTPAMFLADAAKTAVIAAVLGAPLLLAVLALMRSGKAWWWLGAWAVWAVFSLALIVLYPLAIAPLFNRFTPLADEALRRRIAALLERTGFRDSGVFTMDGSRRSSHGNAYFTGLGAAKRVVFYDTLMQRLEADEIEAVLAHELGHFRLRHVVKGMALGMALSLAWLALLGWLVREPWFGASLGVHLKPGIPGNGATLVLFALVAPQITFLLAPLRSAYSRRHEFEADAFAATHASAASLVRALVKLYHDNAATLTPDPVHSAFYDSHPPAAIRIERLGRLAPAAAGP